ncbi:MAG TPA: hypothetical protein DHM90_09090 [Clostridiaceae bacterium]|nr:hypothetical protein [Clostridiaceae bacterium]
MSSLVRSLAETHESIARDIQDFMWAGRPEKSPKIEHSKEELEEKLLSIREQCWQQYNDAADELEWR